MLKDFKDLEDTFGKLADKAEAELDSLSADKIFNQDFMQRYTDCSDIDIFLSKGGISVDTAAFDPTPPVRRIYFQIHSILIVERNVQYCNK
jgi:hypothetical protein